MMTRDEVLLQLQEYDRYETSGRTIVNGERTDVGVCPVCGSDLSCHRGQMWRAFVEAIRFFLGK
jgi:hypothetical protein